MILLLDNYDSFTYNLKQYLLELGEKVQVVRNDVISLDEIESLSPSHIIISPGPGRPEQAGISVNLIKKFSGQIPILGVCLGHQAIAYAFGGEIVSAPKLMHGKTSQIKHSGEGLFLDLPNDFVATRYHSLLVKKDSLPNELEVTATSEDGEIMAIKHKTNLTEGVQFHPESILTLQGKNLLKNFLNYKYSLEKDNLILKESIKNLAEKKDLSSDLATKTMTEIMEGRATPSQLASIITALRLKGETIEEITSLAKVMRAKAIKIKPASHNLIDTCGTGGDGSGTFNISTAAALVVAGAGLKVAKHGNRSMSSRSGSADLLEALGVRIDLSPEKVAQSIDQVGFGFMFAPKLHPAMKYAVGPRKELGIRTVFNLLGPLTNPAGAKFQLMGVYNQNLVEKIAGVLKNLGVERGYVVASDDGLDEVSISAPTLVATIKDDKINVSQFDPRKFGYEYSKLVNIKGGSSEDNAIMIKKILAGFESPQRDVVCLNAGLAISLGKNISIDQGIKLAEESIASGQADRVLQKIIEFTNS